VVRVIKKRPAKIPRIESVFKVPESKFSITPFKHMRDSGVVGIHGLIEELQYKIVRVCKIREIRELTHYATAPPQHGLARILAEGGN
jgi:hypothetical protein